MVELSIIIIQKYKAACFYSFNLSVLLLLSIHLSLSWSFLSPISLTSPPPHCIKFRLPLSPILILKYLSCQLKCVNAKFKLKHLDNVYIQFFSSEKIKFVDFSIKCLRLSYIGLKRGSMGLERPLIFCCLSPTITDELCSGPLSR